MIVYKEKINFDGDKKALKKIIKDYKEQVELWRNNENIAKPIPKYEILDELINVDDFELKSTEKKQEESQKEDLSNKLNVTHEDYDYAFARTNAEDGYGLIEDQLDMMYHEKWKDHIQKVKLKYPKK